MDSATCTTQRFLLHLQLVPRLVDQDRICCINRQNAVVGSSLCGSHVVDAGSGGAEDEGHHLQGAPMGGHAGSVLLQRPRGGVCVLPASSQTAC